MVPFADDCRREVSSSSKRSLCGICAGFCCFNIRPFKMDHAITFSLFKVFCNALMQELVQDVVAILCLNALVILLYIISCLMHFIIFLPDWQLRMLKYDSKKELNFSTIIARFPAFK